MKTREQLIVESKQQKEQEQQQECKVCHRQLVAGRCINGACGMHGKGQ